MRDDDPITVRHNKLEKEFLPLHREPRVPKAYQLPKVEVEAPKPARSGPRLRIKGLKVAKPEDREAAMALRQRAAEAKAKLYELCRKDVNAFCEFVLRDDTTGAPVEQSEFHLDLQREFAKHNQIVVMSHPESGKSNQMIGYVLWALGNNVNLRVMLLYNAEDSAMKTLATIRRYIESSAELHAVFPHLKRGEIWKDDAIVVQRTAYSRDPSIVAVGYNSRRIQGSRVDLLIIDDLLDAVVTGTEAQRRKVSSWVKNTVFTRLTDGAKVAFLTNAWHPRDLAHELVKDRGWFQLKRPIRNADGKIWWSRWTEQRLALLKRSLGALEYARSYECDPRDDGTRVFRPEHVDYALSRGAGYGFLRSIDLMPDNCIVVTGVDLASAVEDSTKNAGAKTVLTSVFFHPNQDRQVVRIRAGRWRATQILRELNTVASIFPKNHWIVVENNGVQKWILELAMQNQMEVGVAIVPFQTGRNKADPRFGVASMAAEFETRRWILPKSCYNESEQTDVGELVSQMIDYVPENHTGDYLMSLWFAREVGRRIFRRLIGGDSGDGKSTGSSVRAIG